MDQFPESPEPMETDAVNDDQQQETMDEASSTTSQAHVPVEPRVLTQDEVSVIQHLIFLLLSFLSFPLPPLFPNFC